MQLSNSVSREVNSLRKDASRILGDLDNLHKRLARVGKDQGERLVDRSGKLADELSGRFQDNLEAISEAVSTKIGKVGDLSGHALKNVDSTLRAKPYYFLLGAAVAGLVFGFAPQLFNKKS